MLKNQIALIDKYIQNGELDKAESECLNILKTDENNNEVFNILGKINLLKIKKNIQPLQADSYNPIINFKNESEIDRKVVEYEEITENTFCWCGGKLQKSVHALYSQCEICGTQVVRRRFSSKELQNFYSLSGYWHDHQIQTSGYPSIEVRVKSDFNDRIPFWYDLVKKYALNSNSLLEIGCSHGGFLHYCRQHGITDVVGVEVDEETCKFAKQYFDLPSVCSGLFPDVKLPYSSYDIITGFDVIEHFANPVKAIKAIENLLSDKGIFIFQTPCYRGETDDWLQFRPEEHIFLYNEKSIKQLFMKCGLEITDILPGYFPDDMFVIGRKLKKKLIPNPEEIKKIIFIRTDSIGDNVLASSLLLPIHNKFNNSKITIICQPHIAELYDSYSFIEQIIQVDVKKYKGFKIYRDEINEILKSLNSDILFNAVYSRDPIIDELSLNCKAEFKIAFEGDTSNISESALKNNNKIYSILINNIEKTDSELRKYEKYLENLEIEYDKIFPSINITKEDVKFADELFKEYKLSKENTFIIAPYAQNEIRDYLKLYEIIEKYPDVNFIILAGQANHSQNEILERNKYKNIIDLSGKTTICQMAALIQKSKLFVGVESAGAHIACAVNTPNVVIVGGGHFGRFLPYSELTSLVIKPISCYGCNWLCRFERAYCVKDIEIDLVLTAIENKLNEQSEKPNVFFNDLQELNSMDILKNFLSKFISINNIKLIEVKKCQKRLNQILKQGVNIIDDNFNIQNDNSILVSAIVSTYNSEKYIEGCLQDLTDQTLFKKGQLEIIVIDSASQQNEKIIVEKFQSKYDNIKYLRTDIRESIYTAWNRGIQLSSGKYITNANTDDRHRYDALEIMANLLNENSTIGLVYADQYITYNENQTFENFNKAGSFDWPDFDRIQLIHCAFCGPQPMWRKNLHEKYGLFDESFVVAGDYEWNLRISDKVTFYHIKEKLGLYLLSKDSIEHHNNSEMVNETDSLRINYAKKAGLNKLDYTIYKPSFINLDDINNKLISIIIPTYNRPKLLADAITSVINQTLQYFEIVVINDAGEDVSAIIEKFHDSRIKYLTNSTNKGIAFTRNRGINFSIGKYIAYLDDDDLLLPNHLETLFNVLNKSEYKIAYTDAERLTYEDIESLYLNKITKIDIPYSKDFDKNLILTGNFIPTLCIMHDRECLNGMIAFDEHLNSHEDWDLWIRISRKYDFYHIPEITCRFGFVENSLSLSGDRVKMFYSAIEVLKKSQKYVDLKWVSDERYKFITWFMQDANIQNCIGVDENFNLININIESDILKIKEDISTYTNELATEFKMRPQFSEKCAVSFVIITHNNLDITKICIDSIFLTCNNFGFEIIIVDNDSQDGTRDYLKELNEKHENIKIKLNDSNESFSKANNDGYQLSSGKYLIFMNNDISLFEKSIESIIEIFESNMEIAVQGAKLLYPSKIIQHCGIVYGYLMPEVLSHFHIYVNAKENETFVNESREYQFVTGALMAVRSEVFEKADGFDENYFYGHEDLDLCLKIRKLGFKVWYNSKAVAYHFESATKKSIGLEKFERYVTNPDSYDFKNEYYFRKKWKDYIKIDSDDYYIKDGFFNLIYDNEIRGRLIARLDKLKVSLTKVLSFNDENINYRLVELLNIDNKPLKKGKQAISLNRLPIDVLENIENYLREILEHYIGTDEIPDPIISNGLSKPKILYTMFGWNDSGGGTILPKSMAIDLAKSGYEISVFYAGMQHSYNKTPYYLEYTKYSGVNLFGLFNREKDFFLHDRPDLEIKDERVLPYFEKILDDFKPDILHIHSILGLSFAMVEMAKSKGIKIIYTTHNYYFIDPRLYMLNSNLEYWKGTEFNKYSELINLYPDKLQQYNERMKYAKMILKNDIDLTLAVSNRVKELLIEFGADKNKIKVINQIPSGIEFLKDNYHERFELHTPIKFGFIGTVIPQKGVHSIIAAASLITGTNTEFHIYGFGSNSYIDELKKFDKNNKIIWHGEYKFEEFPDIADNIDAIIIPSIWEDCAPLVVVEALAMGLPVIGANIGGIPDFIDNGVNGILFESGNHIELAEILVDLINNPQKLINMRKNTKVSLTFSDFMNKIKDIYNSDIDKVEDWKFKQTENGF